MFYTNSGNNIFKKVLIHKNYIKRPNPGVA